MSEINLSSYTGLDISYCRKVLEFAEAKHDDFTHNQGVFYGEQECGTTGCMAGIACLLHPEAKVGKHYSLDFRGKPASWAQTAKELMGLTGRQRWDLFFRNLNSRQPEKNAINLLRRYIERAELAQSKDGL